MYIISYCGVPNELSFKTKIMISPFNQKPMLRKHKASTFQFRKEEFHVRYHYFECTQTKEVFTDEELDEINMNQVYNQYREKYGIPFPQKISAIRKKYDISAPKISEILGLGVNSYRLYEAGEMPSVSNGRLILSIEKPEAFLEQVEASIHFLSEKEQMKLTSQIQKLQEQEKSDLWDHLFEEKIFTDHKPSEYNGYRIPDLEKIAKVISFFSEATETYKTKLNKLLFYTDFLMYKRTAHSMTGISYKAIPYGPVPAEYDKMYVKLCDDDKINIKPIAFSDGNYGEKIIGREHATEDFNAIELDVLSSVLELFKSSTTKEVVDISHNEPAWIENEPTRNVISYQKYAFDLKAI